MTRDLPPPPSFAGTVRLLLGVARKRAVGRRLRQQELFRGRAREDSTDWSGLGFALAALVIIIINIAAAFAVSVTVNSAERFETERSGKIVVSSSFLDEIHARAEYNSGSDRSDFDRYYVSEADRIASEYGGTRAEVEQKLREEVRENGGRNFVTRGEAAPGMTSLPKAGPLPAMLGSIALFWWAAMLVFQGEGLELDLQRRRHPMWEWLFTHPVPAGRSFWRRCYLRSQRTPSIGAARCS